MRISNLIPLLVLTAVLWSPVAAPGDDSDEPGPFSGNVSVAGKYDTNIDLAGNTDPEDAYEHEDVEGAYITELSATLAFSSQWDSPWHLALELFGLADIYARDTTDTWLVGRENFYLGYDFGSNNISLLNEARYFTEPDDRDEDNFKNTASLIYKRTLSRLWQGRIGYENILHLYPNSSFFDYYVNGGFLEIRNTWKPAFSTYYSYGFQYYQGSFNAGTRDPLSSPEAGYRHTGEIGFEAIFARKNFLTGSYSLQVDNSSGQSVEQIGDFRGDDENLEVDAEFNFIKHKGTLLFSHKFNERFTLSLYEELINKTFLERNEEQFFGNNERNDMLFLSSIWFKARLVSELYAKTRYLYRMNQSSLNYEDFQDHIVYFGVEYCF